jgi:hypothetical protein
MKRSKSLLTLGFTCAAFTFSLAVCMQAQTFTTIGAFDVTNGQYPNAPLAQATNGNFYGTTYVGGLYSKGTIF